MYITAGLANEQHGVFAAITANAAAPPRSRFQHFRFADERDVAIESHEDSSNGERINGFNSACNLPAPWEPANSQCTISRLGYTRERRMATTTLTLATRMPGGVTGKDFTCPAIPLNRMGEPRHSR